MNFKVPNILAYLLVIMFYLSGFNLFANSNLDDFEFIFLIHRSKYSENVSFKSKNNFLIKESYYENIQIAHKHIVVKDSVELTPTITDAITELCVKKFSEFAFEVSCRHLAPISAFMSIKNKAVYLVADYYPCIANPIPVEFITVEEYLNTLYND